MRVNEASAALFGLGLLMCGCAIGQPQSSVPAREPAPNTACQQAIDYNRKHFGPVLIVMKSGEVICEDYTDGFRPDRPHTLFSGSKSYAGVVAAAAAADGLLSLDEPVADTITEWQEDPLKSEMTIRELLSLTSGLDTQGPRWAPAFEQALALPAATEPGTEFRYGPIVFQIFGAVIERKLREAGRDASFEQYLANRVLGPAGVTPPRWLAAGRPPVAIFRSRRLPDPLPTLGDNDPNLAAGAVASAREWAGFGEFVRTWPDRLRPDLDKRVFDAQFDGTNSNPGYGLGWWLAREMDLSNKESLGQVMAAIDMVDGATAGEIPDDVAAALGAAGQMLFIIPSRQVVAVRFGAPPRGVRRTAAGSEGFSHTDFIKRVLAITAT